MSGECGGSSLCSFTALVTVRIARASNSLVLLISSGIIKMFLKTMVREKKKRHKKITLLVSSKLNSIKKIYIYISKALINSDISHDEFAVVINEEQIHFRLKENIRAKGNQLGDFE